MTKELITTHQREPTEFRRHMPTPLYVATDVNPKRVILSFNTQEEADYAFRLLSQLAAEHADRTKLESES